MKVAIHGRNIADKQIANAYSIFDFFVKKGITPCVYASFLKHLEQATDSKLNLPTYCHSGEIPSDTDFMVSIGGDGTFLDAARFVREKNIPLVGVNLGRLGFLTYISGNDALSSIEQITTGNFTVEERSMLQASGNFFNAKHTPFALNEVTVQRKGVALIEIAVLVDNEPLSSYWADGLIMATPTGSTAYSMSAGGPIVAPCTRAIILSPIAPHNLSVRPIVVPDSSTIKVNVATREGKALLAIDNQKFEVDSGTSFEVKKSQHAIKMLKPANSNFYRTLRNKLFWGVDPRS